MLLILFFDDATIFPISALSRNLVNISCDDVIKRWGANAARKISIVAIVGDKEDLALWIKYKGTWLAYHDSWHGTVSVARLSKGNLSSYLDCVAFDAAKQLAHVDGGAVWETVQSTILHPCVGVTTNPISAVHGINV